LKYYVENFGCQMNDHDVEKVNRLLSSSGFDLAEELDQAQVVLVNTCCVREKAEQKFYSFMGRLRTLKRRKGLILGIMGCIAQLEKENLLERLPFIDFSLGPSALHRVSEAISAALDKKRLLDFSDNHDHATLYIRPGAGAGKLRSFVTIMKGCNNFCSYCVVPYVRGREVSRSSVDILEEVSELASSGVREVILLGQNVNSYNIDRDDVSFPDLLKRIDKIDGIERIRFVTSHPKDLSPDLIACFGGLQRLCEQIHLPFQSGSSRILKLMNRGYTIEEYKKKVEALRERCPGVAITSDCIVGFPGETEEDFELTMDLVEEMAFDGVFSFCFSPRKYARASTLPGMVPRDAALARLHRLQERQKEITRRIYESMEGSVVEVLVEGPSKTSSADVTGRTRTNRIVNFKGVSESIGKLVDVKIVKGFANSLRGA
jgi:tRNA-2-methylthio-N6-dimethylallyladenosine synthase